MNSRIKKAALIRGLLLGIIVLALNIFTFYFMTSITKSPVMIVAGQFVFSMILPCVAAILVVMNLRKQVGTYWEFRKAVSDIFIVFLTSFIVLSVGRDVIFAKVVEPQMAQKLNQSMVSATRIMLEKAKATPAQIESKIQDNQKQFDAQANASVGSIIEGLIISIIFLFVFSLIFAMFFKKDPPAGFNDTTVDPTV